MALAARFSGWIALRNGSVPPTPTGEAVLYSEAGVAKVKQPDGQVIPIVTAVVQDAGVWSGGNASTNFTGQPLLRAGGAS
jgi:hypothetical protein